MDGLLWTTSNYYLVVCRNFKIDEKTVHKVLIRENNKMSFKVYYQMLPIIFLCFINGIHFNTKTVLNQVLRDKNELLTT